MNNVLTPELVARAGQISDEVLVLAFEAFRQGRHTGVANACAELERFIRRQVVELERQRHLAPAERAALMRAFERMRAELERMLCEVDRLSHPSPAPDRT